MYQIPVFQVSERLDFDNGRCIGVVGILVSREYTIGSET